MLYSAGGCKHMYLRRWLATGWELKGNWKWNLDWVDDCVRNTHTEIGSWMGSRPDPMGRQGLRMVGCWIVNNFMSSTAIIYAILLTLGFCCNSCVCLTRRRQHAVHVAGCKWHVASCKLNGWMLAGPRNLRHINETFSMKISKSITSADKMAVGLSLDMGMLQVVPI